MENHALKITTQAIEFFSIKPNTVAGKMKLLILFFISALIGLSYYIYLQAESINNDYYKLEKYAFAFQTTFIIQTEFLSNQLNIINGIDNHDTTLSNFSTQNLHSSLDTSLYALSLAGNTIDYQTDSVRKVFNEFEALGKSIGQQILSNKNLGIESVSNDSLLRSRINSSNIVGRFYGSLFGDYFQKLIEQKDKTNLSLLQHTAVLPRTVITISILLAILFVIIGKLILNSLRKSIDRPKAMLEDLAVGRLPEKLKDSEDELSYIIAVSNQLATNLTNASEFALQIGQSNFDYQYIPSGSDDILGNALLKMRHDLHVYHEKENQQNWAISGQAKFAEIIRGNNHGLKITCDQLISNLVKYLHANQGGMFFFDEDSQNLNLLSCYAYDRKKFLQKNIEIGEGMVGQCFQEGQTIYMNDVPEDYIYITSGLGTANPRAILIVPMVYNDRVEGVIELASFEDFVPYQVAFVEKLGEMLGSSVNAIKRNTFTEKLLAESQNKSQSLGQQEEELRQNLEELHATQEEMMIREKTYLAEISHLKETLEEKKRI